MAPDWHYLRDILLPAVEKLPATPAAPSTDRPTPLTGRAERAAVKLRELRIRSDASRPRNRT